MFKNKGHIHKFMMMFTYYGYCVNWYDFHASDNKNFNYLHAHYTNYLL